MLLMLALPVLLLLQLLLLACLLLLPLLLLPRSRSRLLLATAEPLLRPRP
jgi:hypothetical protein